ncbi:MAG TPA: prenyltransferase/squalene oxidase repeat-containing protein, partial [Chloroflexia bacterium]
MVHIVGAVTIGKRAYRKLSTRLVLSLLLVAALMMGIGLTLSKMLAPNSGSADTWVLRQLELSKPPSPLTVENTAWAAKTSALIERTHNWDGPFTGNFSEASRFDLYTTYYAVMTFQALNMPVPNKAQTIARVQSAQVREGTFQDDFHCKGASPENVQQGNLQDNLIGCTFYAVMTLDALGAKVNDEAAVIRLIDELQSDVSPYVFNNAALAPGEANLSPGEQSQQTQAAILYSRQALSILKKLGGQPQRADELRNWLLSQWNDNSQITQELRSISRLANIGEALELLGVRLADLSNAPARFAWARSFVSISDLSSGNKQVNLFAISDWLSLTSRLSGTQGSSDLLGDNFFQGLSELQQASGSFNAVLANEPDLQGTYLAAGLFRAAGRPIPGAEHIGELLRWQTLPEGGFRPVYKTGYSHPAFTVFSIDTLAMLGADEGDLSNTLTAKFAQDNISMVLTDSDE